MNNITPKKSTIMCIEACKFFATTLCQTEIPREAPFIYVVCIEIGLLAHRKHVCTLSCIRNGTEFAPKYLCVLDILTFSLSVSISIDVNFLKVLKGKRCCFTTIFISMTW